MITFCKPEIKKDSFCLSIFLSPTDVWQLDFWDAGLYGHGHHGHVKGKRFKNVLALRFKWYFAYLRFGLGGAILQALFVFVTCPYERFTPFSPRLLELITAGIGDSLLDVDEPFCDVGLNCLLLHLLSLLRRNHLVRKVPTSKVPNRRQPRTFLY